MQRTNNAIPNGSDWRSMIESHHSKELWKAIAWNGEIKNGQDEQTSGDEDFRLHFKELLNPIIERENLGASVETEDTGIYFPVTDDPIEPREVAEAAKSLKTNKSGGPSGLPRTPQIPTSDMVNLPCWGISIMKSVAKLYDIVLNRRLTQWYKPDREQTGAQKKKKGCSKHLLTLRMLTDIAKHRR
ncbi:hypothetical protein CAPTEDRAFT_206152, partial [Capitella teleta]